MTMFPSNVRYRINDRAVSSIFIYFVLLQAFTTYRRDVFSFRWGSSRILRTHFRSFLPSGKTNNIFTVTIASTSNNDDMESEIDEHNSYLENIEDIKTGVYLPTNERSIADPNSEVSTTKNTVDQTGDYFIPRPRRKKMEVTWCDILSCHTTSIRETVVGPNNHISFQGPATGQVMYCWCDDSSKEDDKVNYEGKSDGATTEQIASVLLLVKQHDEELLTFAAQAVKELTEGLGLQVLLAPELAARMKFYFGVDNPHIRLFERELRPDFGSLDYSTRPATRSELPATGDLPPYQPPWLRTSTSAGVSDDILNVDKYKEQASPDLVCTLGGDGLLMYASSLFPGPVPPILCIAGGSLGFLTPFSRSELIDAVKHSLGLITDERKVLQTGLQRAESRNCSIFPGMATLGDSCASPGPENNSEKSRLLYGPASQICVSMRMRLDCRVINRDGVVRARYNVLNEVVVDRGSSSYLAHLECYCDDVHLTTVQADGIIFSTPTGYAIYHLMNSTLFLGRFS